MSCIQMASLPNTEMYSLILLFTSASLISSDEIAPEFQQKLILDKLDILQDQLQSVHVTLHEVQQKNMKIEHENIILKKENAILRQDIAWLNTETENIKWTMQQHTLNSTMQERDQPAKKCDNTRKISTGKESKNIFTRTNVEDGLGNSFQKRLLIPDGTSQIVAFTAVLTHQVSLGPLQTVQFDKVITNIGNAYEPQDGHFTAPVNGVYMISATVYSSGKPVHTEVVKNGIQLVAMYGDDDDDSGHTIMVALNKNDRVYVRHFDDNNAISSLYSGADRYFISFSGALIAQL